MRLLTTLFILIPAIVFGQEKVKKTPRPFEEGYILYSDGKKPEQGLVQVPEKKRGLVNFNFRKSNTGVIREIRVEQATVLGFGFRRGAEYHALDYTHDSIPGRFFVKVLVAGNMSLYSDNDTLILKLQSGTTHELTSSNFRDLLYGATATCPAANQMAQHLRFDPEVLSDFVKGYNKCLNNDPGTFDPFATKKIFYLGISAGIEFTTLDIEALDYYPRYSLSDEKHIFAGLLLYIPYAKSQALEFGVIYKPREFHGTGKGGSPSLHPGVRTSDISISYNELLIPATFRQAIWRKNKTTIQGSAGVALPVIISQSSQIATTDDFNSYTRPVVLSKSIQYNIGVGAEIIIKERQRLLIQNVFFYGPASLSTFLGYAGSSVMGYSLFIGYTL